MKLRPCIDIHDGKVKQIVGGSISDTAACEENFVSERDSSYFAELFRKDDVRGGHVILLNKADDLLFEATRQQALLALKTFPGGLQIGGGINPDNAAEYIESGASHVIVTSYVFSEGELDMDRVLAMSRAAGREHLVLDLSCRKKGDDYYVVTNRWQTFTNQKVSCGLFEKLLPYCDEFLIHGVDSEGKRSGIEEGLLGILGTVSKELSAAKNILTYAGGVRSISDMELIRSAGGGKIDVTVGSALDLFGGDLKYKELIKTY